MGLLDVPARPVASAADGALEIRRIMKRLAEENAKALLAVRKILAKHGQVEIEAALGADAADLTAAYSAMKVAVTDSAIGVAVPTMDDEIKKQDAAIAEAKADAVLVSDVVVEP